MTKLSDYRELIPGCFSLEELTLSKPPYRDLTIARIDADEVGADREEKPVLFFKETRKRLVLSRGRIDSLIELFGDVTSEALVGKRIRIAPGRARAGNRTVTTITINTIPEEEETNE